MVVSEDASRQGQDSRLQLWPPSLFSQALSQWKMKEKLHILRIEISVARKTKGLEELSQISYGEWRGYNHWMQCEI